MPSAPAGVRRVISTASMPPASRALPSGTAWAGSSRTTTGMTGQRPSREFTGFLLVAGGVARALLSAGVAGSGSPDDLARPAGQVGELVGGGEPLPVAGHLADGAAEEVAGVQAVADRAAADEPGEVAGDEGVTGADGVDHLHRPGRCPLHAVAGQGEGTERAELQHDGA